MGDPAKEICRVAEEEAVDLIAMATHGHRGVSDIIHGQTVDASGTRSRFRVLLRADSHLDDPDRPVSVPAGAPAAQLSLGLEPVVKS